MVLWALLLDRTDTYGSIQNGENDIDIPYRIYVITYICR